MKMPSSLLIIFSFWIAVDSPKNDEANMEQEKMQGTWAAVSYVENGQEVEPKKAWIRWVFKGDKVTFPYAVDEASVSGTFKLDPSKKPKAIDMTFSPAPGEKKDRTMQGIYEMEGDTLKICCGPHGVKRATEFKSKAGTKHIMVVFKLQEIEKL